jgi:flagellar biosynthetic protein FlhB
VAEEAQGQDKNEEATPRKREKAREEGQAARSRELNTMAMLVAGSFATLAFARHMGEQFSNLMTSVAVMAAHPDGQLTAVLELATTTALHAALPLMLVVFVAAMVGSGATGGFVFSTKAMAFNASRMNPLSGLQRMFSVKSLIELGKAIAKFAIVGAVAFAVLELWSNDLLRLGLKPLPVAIVEALTLVGKSFVALSCSLILIAAIDVPIQLADFNNKLKMTRQEVRDELKDSEGRPEVKSRIRRLQQEIARRRMLQDIPKADVVITNPQHYSVALQYVATRMSAPKVIAKGADLLAFKIRELATASRVPIVASPALTRAIYHSTDVGDEVPAPLYVAIAQILAFVYQLKQYRRGSGPRPRPLADLDIPAEYRRDS